MKALYRVYIVIFFLLFTIPFLFMNREEGYVSKIDNRQLSDNPFGENSKVEGFAKRLEGLYTYFTERYGLRGEMLHLHGAILDGLFGEVEHGLYEDGRDGYVFSKRRSLPPLLERPLGDYYIAFAKMVGEIQGYCHARGVPFLFVLNPSKDAIYADKLPCGKSYNREWVDAFCRLLAEKSIRYLDNTVVMREVRHGGGMPFNRRYDANHWNDLGAFHGVNAILGELKRDFPTIIPNEAGMYYISDTVMRTLPVSNWPIRESVPYYKWRSPVRSIGARYAAEVRRHEQYRHFAYYVNDSLRAAGAPRVLVFQGSYMNQNGSKFMAKGVGEYISVHDYQNVLDFDYYFEIFRPAAVVFEVAEYTINNTYFDHARMQGFRLAPPLDSLGDVPVGSSGPIAGMLAFDEGKALTTVRARGLPQEARYAYLTIGGVDYTMRRSGLDTMNGAFEVSLERGICEGGAVMALTAVDGAGVKYVWR